MLDCPTHGLVKAANVIGVCLTCYEDLKAERDRLREALHRIVKCAGFVGSQGDIYSIATDALRKEEKDDLP